MSKEDCLNALSPEEREIYIALRDHHSGDKDFASMYLGSRICWSDTENPERLHLTAHCLRELMDELRKKNTTRENRKGLGEVVKELNKKYEKIKSELRSDDGSYRVESVEKLLQVFEELKTFEERDMIGRTEGAVLVIKRMRRVELPIAPGASDWNKLATFFTAVAHHGKDSKRSEEVVLSQIRALDKLLLPLVKPQSTSNINNILALVKRIENDNKRAS